MITLRDYQVEARDAVLGAWERGKRSVFAFLCTGAGKTEIALSVLAEEYKRNPETRALILAHRDELITQPKDRIAAHWTHALPVPGIVSGKQKDYAAPLAVATVQTVYKEDVLDKILDYGLITHIWCDESHHAPSDTYKSVFEYLKSKNPDLRILGVTATPIRTDKVGLGTVFEECVYKFPIDKAIKAGALVPFIGIGIELPVDFSGLDSKSESGFDDEKAGEILSLANAEEVIIESWKKHAADRKTIAFTSSVSQAYSLARAFNAAGVRAEALDGDKKRTPNERRQQVLQDFRDGKIQVVCNAQLLTEGVDIPDISCVLMAKPTKSDTTYTQAVGRGLRLAPGKKDCLILDFAPMNARNMRMAGDLLGKPREVKKQEERAKEKGVILDCFAFGADGSTIEGDPSEVQTKILDYLGSSHLAWTFDGLVSSVSIGQSLALAIVKPQTERVKQADELRTTINWTEKHEKLYQLISNYQVYAIERSGRYARFLGCEADWQAANYLATDYADNHGEDILSGRSKKWRMKPASEKQQQMCVRLGVWRDGMRMGEASQAITHALAIQALKNAGAMK